MKIFSWMILVVNHLFLKRILKASLVIQVSLFFLWGCGEPDYHKLTASSMGTTLNVVYQPVQGVSSREFDERLLSRLQEVEDSMSTYKESSEISRFNQLELRERLTVSEDFQNVYDVSLRIYQQSYFSFNPAVAVLVNLWGFGPDFNAKQDIPDQALIEDAMGQLNFSTIRREGDTFLKLKPISIDFSAVAKGYGVDVVADFLDAAGMSNYMIELGGEVYAKGVNSHGHPWRIAIEKPNALSEVPYILKVQDFAVATSGDYRNFITVDGKQYSHTIDPVTGFPVDHDLSSVSVIADTVAEADAWATAFMVLGREKSDQLANQYDLGVYFIYRTGDEFAISYNEKMKSHLVHAKSGID